MVVHSDPSTGGFSNYRLTQCSNFRRNCHLVHFTHSCRNYCTLDEEQDTFLAEFATEMESKPRMAFTTRIKEAVILTKRNKAKDGIIEGEESVGKKNRVTGKEKKNGTTLYD